MGVIIRRAKIEDTENIVDVGIKTWETTYGQFFKPEVFERRRNNRDKNLDWWSGHLNDEDHNAYVAVVDGKIVGFLDFFKESRSVKNCAEVGSIYILKEYQGLGLGRKLMNKAFELCKTYKIDRFMLNVLNGSRAFNFYKQMGGALIGSANITVGGEEFKENVIEFKVK